MTTAKDTVSAKPRNFIADGSQLYTWLGSFWSQIFTNPELLRDVQAGQGILSAQLYLNFLEAVGLLNRNEAPAFHRERWHNAAIRRSQANTGAAAGLKFGLDPAPVFGIQDGATYAANEIFTVGGTAELTNMVSYPLAIANATNVVTMVTSNIVAPEVVLVRDRDFTVRDQTIFFLRDHDPFTNSKWPRQQIGTDEEIMLWCCDTMIDVDQVYNYLGYVLGIRTASSEFYVNLINALWDLHNQGTPLAWFRLALGAIFNEPVILNDTETVEVIVDYDGTGRQVITDANVYDVSASATLRDEIVPDAVLHRGDFLTETLRIYETLDPARASTAGEFGARIITDVPSLWLNPQFFAAPMRFGLGFDRKLSDIVSAGTDANGNPKLKFTVYGDATDIDVFWQEFWSKLETQGISSLTCFQGYLYDTVSGSGVYGKVSPLEYVLRYFLSANAAVLVVDRPALAPEPGFREIPSFVTACRRLLPAHMYVFIVERRELEAESYDMDLASDITKSWDRSVNDTAREGMASAQQLTYRHAPVVKHWVPVCSNGG